MMKKTILAALAGATLIASNAALADRDHYRGHGKGHHKHQRHVEYRPVVQHYHYQRPVVVHREVIVHRPAPVYYQPVDPNAGLVIAGALIGGAVAWHIVNGH